MSGASELRRIGVCIYLATEETAARDIQNRVNEAANLIDSLIAAGSHLIDMIEAQERYYTPAPKRETDDDANSRDERDQVFADAVERFRAALKGGVQ